MIAPRHVMILASAGSGKTYALTSRFVALLAAGAPPERIVALTFTRKAAGEFFDGILRKLAGAARSPKEARRLAADIGRPGLRTEDFGRLLRGVADAMHRLRLGTLDSFFARVARSFPFELGLAGDFEILQEHAARLERRRVLQRLFARAGALAEAQHEFLEAFRRATFGTEEKQLAQRLDRFLDEHYQTYLTAPDGAAWGDAARVWPAGRPWRDAPPRDTVVAALRRWLATAEMDAKQRPRWQDFIAALAEWSPGAPLARPLTYLLEKALAEQDALAAGTVELVIERRKQRLDAAGCAVLRDAVAHIAAGEIARRLETTRGIHAVLRAYDAIYDRAVRRAGRLTFADVERLLHPDGGRLLTRAGAAGDRLFLDYRLDAEIDHWLLDEFQDTSRDQWSVLRNLIDEVVQDEGGQKSFFCVGDVKQSIFAWRAGDPRLMGEIRDHYNGGADGPIVTQPLDASWRSGPAIIGMVNTVFGAAPVLAEMFPGGAGAAWNANWRAHTTARPGLRGQAALLHAADEAERHRVTLDLIRELRPLARGLTCAVLVRRNDQAATIADYLRREGGVPAVAESDLAVCTDNPVGAALLALVHAAAHPGDTLAWKHVQMTPLAEALRAEGIGTPEELTWRLTAEIHAQGFERAMEHWLARLLPRVEGGREFAQERARQFAAAAALFDATGSRDLDEFGAFMRRHRVREPESASVVRVMTIHKSKGLGFDVVIVPELQGNRIDEPRGGLAVQREGERDIGWVLEMPTGLFARADPVLGDYVARAEQDAAYESLSLLYVALTRAKRALYVVTELAEESKSRNFPKLLGETLGHEAAEVSVGAARFAGPWAAGEADWAEEITPAPPPAPPPSLPTVAAPPVPRLVARRPSAEKGGVVAAASLFAWREDAALEFGRTVHRLLAEVAWCDAAGAAAHAARWRAAGVEETAVAHALAALTAPALAAVWTEPSAAGGGSTELWRERPFEIVLDGTWVTGVFDRVVVRRDATGRATDVTVWDFKTDRVEDDASALAAAVARHAGQLTLYRRVAAVLAGLSEPAVAAGLVLTGTGRLSTLGTG